MKLKLLFFMCVCCFFGTMKAQNGDPSVFGDNVWNVYVYQSNDNSFPVANYAGFYTESNLSFDTQDRWNSSSNPSAASGYLGNVVSDDYHSYTAKRRGFTPGYYMIDIPGHDDHAYLFIDGVQVWYHVGCCDAHANVWNGNLDANSTVEYRIVEYDGGSNGAITIAPVTIKAVVANFSASSCQTDVTIIATGGKPPYTGTGTFPVGPGTYTYTVTDATLATSSTTVEVKDDVKPTAIAQNLTVNLDADGQAVVTPELVNNNSLDNCGISDKSLDKMTFSCSDIGTTSQAVGFAYMGRVSQNVHAVGGGFNPTTNEFWYPQWPGSTIYKYDASHNLSGSFDAPVSEILQLWMDKSSSDYYTANYSPKTIKRISGNSTVWSYTLSGKASAVTTNDLYVFAKTEFGNTVVVLDKTTGAFVKNITLPGSFFTYGGLVYANGILYISGRDSNGVTTVPWAYNAIHAFDANSGAYIGSVATAQDCLNTAFDGETIWISDRSGTIDGYKVSVPGTTVNLTVTDAAGNTDTTIARIIVKDMTAPVITSNGDKIVNNDLGVCGALVDVSASAADNCSVGTPTGARSDTKLLTDLYPIGATTITWNVTDANGNAAVATQTVTVTDNEVPVITADGDKNVVVDQGVCGASVNVSATATDNCSVAAPIGVRSDGGLLTDLYPLGVTNITWNVADANGNAAVEITQTVTVTDNVFVNTITRNLNTLTADEAGATAYQWMTLVGGIYENLAGEVNQSYKPTVTGTYSVEISKNGCTQRSAVVNVDYGDPNAFGDNVWNIYTYQSVDSSFPAANYAGFYTETNLSFDTRTSWDVASNPSVASGYSGAAVTNENHSYTAKRKGFTPGYYSIDIPGHDDSAYLLINGVQVWYHDGCCDAHPNVWEGKLDANSTVEYQIFEFESQSYGAITFTIVPLTIKAAVDNFSPSYCQKTVTITATGGQPPYDGTGSFIVDPGIYDYRVTDAAGATSITTVEVKNGDDPSFFGDNVWNINAYQSTDSSFPLCNYSGFYTESNLSFDTKDRWDSNGSPSAASGYLGNVVSDDYHSYTAKRRGFPPGYYVIDLPGHDDSAYLLIDGVEVWNHEGCCDAHPNVWNGNLDANSTVEYRIIDFDAQSYGAITLTTSPLTINAAVANFSDSSCQTTVTITATGGLPPYDGTGSFIKDPGVYNYTVTDAAGGTSSTTVEVKDDRKPLAITRNLTVNLDAQGQAVVTPEMINNNSTDNCAIASMSLDKFTFFCSDIGAFTKSQVLENTYVGRVSQDTHSYGGGFNPNTNEFWYPEWPSKKIYKYDASHNPTGSFDAPVSEIMQLWMDNSSSDYYVANYYNKKIMRINGSDIVWSYDLKTTASCVTTNDLYVFAMGYYANSIVVLDKATGAFVKNISLPGNFATFGGLVWANGILYIAGFDDDGISTVPHSQSAIHAFDANTGAYISSVATSQDCRNTAFDGETIWVSANSPTIDGYKVSNGNAYGGGTPGNVVNLTVTDAGGNTDTATARIIVKDNTAPVITTNGDITVSCGANVDVSATATDNCSVTTPTGVRSDGELLSAVYPVGTTTITWNVSDANANAAVAVTQTVTVIDNEIPVITANGNKSVKVDSGVCGASVIVSATATDNCSVGTPTGVRSDAKLLTDLYPVGTTTITWNVADVNGNNAVEVIQTVTVTDNVLPIVLIQDITVTLDPNGNATITAAQIDNGSSDACGSVTLELDITTFTCANVGPNTVTLTVIDESGNTSMATATVTVNSSFINTISRNLDTLTADQAGATTYQWMTFDGGVYANILNETNQSLNVNTAGSYAVDITKNGCTQRSAVYDMSTLGNKDFEFKSKITVHPNPFNDVISINVDSSGKIKIYDLLGKTIYTKNINSGTTQLDLGNYATGMYLLQVTNENNQSKQVKIMKK